LLLHICGTLDFEFQCFHGGSDIRACHSYVAALGRADVPVPENGLNDVVIYAEPLQVRRQSTSIGMPAQVGQIVLIQRPANRVAEHEPASIHRADGVHHQTQRPNDGTTPASSSSSPVLVSYMCERQTERWMWFKT